MPAHQGGSGPPAPGEIYGKRRSLTDFAGEVWRMKEAGASGRKIVLLLEVDGKTVPHEGGTGFYLLSAICLHFRVHLNRLLPCFLILALIPATDGNLGSRHMNMKVYGASRHMVITV